jgi:hypothetical protein
MAVKWHDWKLWYLFRTEIEPDSDNLVRLFDLGVDPREEIDVKDFYPGVIAVMDGIVANYEASLERHPRVPGGIDDPYTPPPAGSGSPVASYRRTDRGEMGPRSEAMPDPDFSGSWSTATVSSAPPTGQAPPPPNPSLGSGWGDRIAIEHGPDALVVEWAVFVPREIQPLVRYRYALDGSTSENGITMGRTGPPTASTTAWDGNRLVITTGHPFQDPATGEWATSDVVQTLWLQPPDGTPFEPALVVETTRKNGLGGLPSTNRTVYVRGYR